MISLEMARKHAKKMFVKNGYIDVDPSAYELPDKWIFISSHFKDDRVDYGSCGISVKKTGGDPQWYSVCSPKNIVEFYDAKKI